MKSWTGLLVVAFARVAYAQPAEPATEPTTVEPPPLATAPDGEARNYEQAPEASSIRGGGIVRGVGTGIGYVFRGIFAPFRGLIYLEARWGAFTKAKELLENDAGTLGLYPSVTYATDFGVTYGGKLWSKGFFGAGEEASISAKTGGAVRQQYQAKLEFPHLGGSPVYVNSRLRYEENTNLLFAGIGNGMNTRTRFSQDRFLGLLSTGVELGTTTRVKIGGSAIFNDRSFGEGNPQAGDPSIETVYDTSMITGFDDGFRNLEVTGDLEIDTRDVKGPTQTGAVLRAFAGGGSLVDSVEYAHYGAEASVYFAPFLPRRVFVVRAALEGIRDRDNDIPFTELPRLGGAGLLRGYSTDQFRGNLAAIGTLEYRYPIHGMISGDLFVETGKVASTYEALLGDGLRDDWHIGYGGGLLFHSRRSVKARIDIAYGDGLQVYFSTDVLDAFRKREREL